MLLWSSNESRVKQKKNVRVRVFQILYWLGNNLPTRFWCLLISKVKKKKKKNWIQKVIVIIDFLWNQSLSLSSALNTPLISKIPNCFTVNDLTRKPDAHDDIHYRDGREIRPGPLSYWC